MLPSYFYPHTVFHPHNKLVRESVKHLSLLETECVWSVASDSATPWTVAFQASLSMEFSRQESWNGLPFPPPGDLPDSGIEPISPALAGKFFTTEPPGKPKVEIEVLNN